MILLRYPKDSERPPAAPCDSDPRRSALRFHEALGSLGGVFDQDDANLPAVQRGMKNSATGKVILASYQESRIRHLHQTIDKYLS